MEVTLTEDMIARYKGAEVFWESWAAWNKCFDDQNKKEAFIAGYISGWDRNEFPPVPPKNLVPVDFK